MKVIRAPLFEADVVECLEWSLENFGENTFDRYKFLISVAIKKIVEDPFLNGSRDFENEVRLYHLRQCKREAPVNGRFVKNPRHLIVYRQKENEIQLVRLLHEQMDLPSRVED